MNLIEFLKKYSKVSNKFIDDFFNLYDINNKNNFIINLENIVKWLNTKKSKIKETLLNSYQLNIDYIINKTSSNGKKGAPKEEILLTVKCFKLLCMQSRTQKAIEVREYFYALEELIDKYKDYIIEGLKDKIIKLENNQKPKVNPSKGVIYIIQTVDDITLYKIGKTSNLKNRLTKYNADKKDNIIPIYVYETNDIDAGETYIKGFMKKYQYRKYAKNNLKNKYNIYFYFLNYFWAHKKDNINKIIIDAQHLLLFYLYYLFYGKEVYQTNIDIIKNFINKCGDIVDSDYTIHLINKNKSQKGGDKNNNYNYYFVLYK